MEKYITLAIHTYNVASALRQVLQKNGISVQLENVNISHPEPACGVRVRIKESDLPKALALVEQSQSLSLSAVEMEFNSVENKLLVPVDFSEESLTACRVAFEFAHALNLHPVLMHVYATPYFDGALSNTDNFTLDIRDAEVRRNMESTAKYEMKRFCKRLDEMMLNEELPSLKYSTTLNEGMPEEAILSFTRQSPPELVVMCTRDADKKAREVMGSVTAEVIDNCRVSVLTWPVGSDFHGIDKLTKAVFFCNVDQNDLLAMDMFVRLMNYMPLEVTLVPVTEKAGSKLTGRLTALLDYFKRTYPLCSFESFSPDLSELREQLAALSDKKEVQLLVVPNKKKNIFARLFNPGIAHRVVFESDKPLLALPV